MILPPWVKPAIAATALLSAFACGWTVQGWRWSAAEAGRLQAEVTAKDKQLAKSNEAAAGFEQDRAQIDTDRRTGETIIERSYETRIVPAECALADDARSVLSKAIQRANSASGVTSKPVPDTP